MYKERLRQLEIDYRDNTGALEVIQRAKATIMRCNEQNKQSIAKAYLQNLETFLHDWC